VVIVADLVGILDMGMIRRLMWIGPVYSRI